ncbi:MAG: hypothetical protein AABZ70_10595 [candidate division NC10 bacterium]
MHLAYGRQHGIVEPQQDPTQILRADLRVDELRDFGRNPGRGRESTGDSTS